MSEILLMISWISDDSFLGKTMRILPISSDLVNEIMSGIILKIMLDLMTSFVGGILFIITKLFKDYFNGYVFNPFGCTIKEMIVTKLLLDIFIDSFVAILSIIIYIFDYNIAIKIMISMILSTIIHISFMTPFSIVGVLCRTFRIFFVYHQCFTKFVDISDNTIKLFFHYNKFRGYMGSILFIIIFTYFGIPLLKQLFKKLIEWYIAKDTRDLFIKATMNVAKNLAGDLAGSDYGKQIRRDLGVMSKREIKKDLKKERKKKLKNGISDNCENCKSD